MFPLLSWYFDVSKMFPCEHAVSTKLILGGVCIYAVVNQIKCGVSCMYCTINWQQDTLVRYFIQFVVLVRFLLRVIFVSLHHIEVCFGTF